MFVLECYGLSGLLNIIKFLLKIVQWVVPVILILLGTIDLVKAVIAGKDDDIKKHQQTLIKRIIAAVIVFLVPVIVSILMGWIGNDEWKTCWNEAKGDFKNVFNFTNLAD